MVELPFKHPDVYAEFMNGNFVVLRSHRKFSLMAKDQSHEHSNKKLQAGAGGLSDMYDDADAIALNVLAVLNMHDSSVAHHEESPALQRRFISDVRKFKN